MMVLCLFIRGLKILAAVVIFVVLLFAFWVIHLKETVSSRCIQSC